jgi:hypothetical protein
MFYQSINASLLLVEKRHLTFLADLLSAGATTTLHLEGGCLASLLGFGAVGSFSTAMEEVSGSPTDTLCFGATTPLHLKERYQV